MTPGPMAQHLRRAQRRHTRTRRAIEHAGALRAVDRWTMMLWALTCYLGLMMLPAMVSPVGGSATLAALGVLHAAMLPFVMALVWWLLGARPETLAIHRRAVERLRALEGILGPAHALSIHDDGLGTHTLTIPLKGGALTARFAMDPATTPTIMRWTPTGSPGSNSTAGPNGPQGPTDPNGPTSHHDSTGSKGTTGPNGTQGPTGPANLKRLHARLDRLRQRRELPWTHGPPADDGTWQIHVPAWLADAPWTDAVVLAEALHAVSPALAPLESPMARWRLHPEATPAPTPARRLFPGWLAASGGVAALTAMAFGAWYGMGDRLLESPFLSAKLIAVLMALALYPLLRAALDAWRSWRTARTARSAETWLDLDSAGLRHDGGERTDLIAWASPFTLHLWRAPEATDDHTPITLELRQGATRLTLRTTLPAHAAHAEADRLDLDGLPLAPAPFLALQHHAHQAHQLAHG